jgi:RNA polymerase sigma-70 factor (ECF subfamily)
VELQQLINACQNNDRKAQKLLMETFAPYLFAISKRYMRDEQEAKDVLQDAFVSIYGNINEYKSEAGAFKSWIRRITVNAALQKLRKTYRKREVMTETIHDDRSVVPDVYDKFNADDLMGVINKLPDMYREVFNLYVIEGFKHKEIAEMMNMQESSSRAVLARAKKQIRDQLSNFEKVAI